MDSFALLIAWSACSRGSSPKTAEHPASTNAESKITTTGARQFIMYLMSESSLPLLDALRLRSFPGGVRRVLGRLLGRRKKKPAPDLALISLAASARKEVEAGLRALRASFASSVGGSSGERAFDLEVERLYPTLGVQGQ